MTQFDTRLQSFNPRVDALQLKILDLENLIMRPDGKMQVFWDQIEKMKTSFES
jgi:hypothetical protein